MKCTRVSLLLIALIGAMLLLSSCTTKKAEQLNTQTGPVAYQVLDTSSDSFEQLPGDVVMWYEDNYRKLDLHSLIINEDEYVLLSAGEKPTGGFSIEEFQLNGLADEIQVAASLRAPGAEDIVTQALTYPHLLVKIKADQRQLTFQGFKGNTGTSNSSEIKQDSGTYTGQIDGNSIEIEISGVPKQNAARAFRFNEQVKNGFDSYQLETGDQVLFSYYVNNNDQQVITKIEKIKN
ncbi:MAG: protease complex subunit PrcB family protein [Bacillota bacterium]